MPVDIQEQGRRLAKPARILVIIAVIVAVLVIVANSCSGDDEIQDAPTTTAQQSGTSDDAPSPSDSPRLESPTATRTADAPKAIVRPIGQEQLLLEEVLLLEPAAAREDRAVFLLTGRPPAPGFSKEVHWAALTEEARSVCDSLSIDPKTTETGPLVLESAATQLSSAAAALTQFSSWFESQGVENSAKMLRSALTVACPEAAWAVYAQIAAAAYDSHIWYIGMDTQSLAEAIAVWPAWGDADQVTSRIPDPQLPDTVPDTICLNLDAHNASPQDVIDDFLIDLPGMRAGATQSDFDLLFEARTAAIYEAIRKCPAHMWSAVFAPDNLPPTGTHEIIRPVGTP